MPTKTDYAAAVLEIAPDLTFKAVFVPWSRSRNAGDKQPSLNWKVTLTTKRGTYTTDYTAGCGHCPSYKQGRQTADQAETVRWECEHGKPARFADSLGMPMARHMAKPILPDLADVLHGLLSDGDAIDYGTFEQWAADLGFDADSRKAEAIYRACIDCGLALRRMFGDETVARLREALRDM